MVAIPPPMRFPDERPILSTSPDSSASVRLAKPFADGIRVTHAEATSDMRHRPSLDGTARRTSKEGVDFADGENPDGQKGQADPGVNRVDRGNLHTRLHASVGTRSHPRKVELRRDLLDQPAARLVRHRMDRRPR